MDCLLQCLGRRPRTTTTVRLEDDDATHAADSFVDTVFLAEKNGIELRQALERLVKRDTWRQATWRERFAKAVFEALQKAIETARPMGDALREIYEKVECAVNDVEGFVKNHPILCALIALGILVLLSPWVIEALGFAEGGILEGEKLDILPRCDLLFQVLTLRRRLLCSRVAIHVCWVRSQGFVVLAATETWDEGICLVDIRHGNLVLFVSTLRQSECYHINYTCDVKPTVLSIQQM